MKPFFTILGVIITGVMYAQVSSYPYTQSFEEPFVYGHKVHFLPDWWGNYIVPDTMGQYDAFAHSGGHSLFMRPEGEEFKTMIQVALDLSSATNTYAEFYVATRKNGLPEDEKRVKLNASVSIDGGLTFPYVAHFGPHEGFPNTNSDFEKFVFVFPPATNNQANVVLRFIGKSGGGPHRPAILLLDDITVMQAEADTFAPYMMGNELTISVTNSLKIPFSEPLLPDSVLRLANYAFTWPVHEDGTILIGDGPLPQVTGVQLTSNGYTAMLTLDPPLSIGETYALEIHNVADLNGNIADLIAVDKIVFNEPAPGSLVFSEVLFADPSSVYPKGKLQFVEIYNPTDKIVPLGGLRIKGAISAHDLPNVKLKPGEYWVATRNAVSYLATFGKEAWEWKGSWIEYEAEEDKTLEPQMLFIQTTNRHGGQLVDSISFDFNDPLWAALNKPGYSMEVCDPKSDRRDPANWSLVNDTEPYFYTADQTAYLIYASPGVACESPTLDKKYCTYTQKFFGTEKSTGCSTNGAAVKPIEIMQRVLPVGQEKVFGLTSTNRYFTLKGSDVSNGSVFRMLPGGKMLVPLQPGGSTFSAPATWGRVPISKHKNLYGTINNGLLSQTITLYFNMGWNSRRIDYDKFTLSTVRLRMIMTAIPSSDCRFTKHKYAGKEHAIISPRLITYLDKNYSGGATVGNLFDLANRMLGGDPALVTFGRKGTPIYKGVTAFEVAFAVGAINNLFEDCGTYLAMPKPCRTEIVDVQAKESGGELANADATDNNTIDAYPNPFSDQVTIVFSAPVDTWAVLQIFGSDGSMVATLFKGPLKANDLKQVTFRPSRSSSGFYTYKLSVGKVVKVGKLLPGG